MKSKLKAHLGEVAEAEEVVDLVGAVQADGSHAAVLAVPGGALAGELATGGWKRCKQICKFLSFWHIT